MSNAWLYLPQLYGHDEMTTLMNAAELFLSTAVPNPSLQPQAANMAQLFECLAMARRNRDIVSGFTLLQRVSFYSTVIPSTLCLC